MEIVHQDDDVVAECRLNSTRAPPSGAKLAASRKLPAPNHTRSTAHCDRTLTQKPWRRIHAPLLSLQKHLHCCPQSPALCASTLSHAVHAIAISQAALSHVRCNNLIFPDSCCSLTLVRSARDIVRSRALWLAHPGLPLQQARAPWGRRVTLRSNFVRTRNTISACAGGTPSITTPS